MMIHLLNLELASSAPAQFVIAGLWQGLLLTTAAWIALKAFPKISPTVAFRLWLSIFIVAALLPIFSLFGASASNAGFSSTHLPASQATGLRVSAGWAAAIVALWCFASLISLARLFRECFRIRLLMRRATPVPPQMLEEEIESLLAKSARKRVRVCFSAEVDGPVAVGFLWSAILIPEWLPSRLTPAELMQVMLHEMAHLERRDDWTNLLVKVIRALFPLNPSLFFAERQLSREREMACDDAVLDAAISPRAYAICLTTLAEKKLLERRHSLAPGAWSVRSELTERVHRILLNNRRMSRLAGASTVSAFLAMTFFASAGLIDAPQMIVFDTAQHQITRQQSVTANALSGTSGTTDAVHFERASLRVPVSSSAFGSNIGGDAASMHRDRSNQDDPGRGVGAPGIRLEKRPAVKPTASPVSSFSELPDSAFPAIILSDGEIIPVPRFAIFQSDDRWIIVQL